VVHTSARETVVLHASSSAVLDQIAPLAEVPGG
jgi:hypothetical protein